MNFPAEPALFSASSTLSALSTLSGVCAHAAAVARLCAAIDAALDACAHPADPSRCAGFARGVRSALAEALADPALLTAAHREGCPQTYRRHLLAADPEGRYAVAALVWQPGHASPVHAHQTWCGYAVCEGTLTESLYRWDETRSEADPLRAQPRAAGAVSFAGRGRGGVHQLGNTSHASAVSLHVYGVHATQMATHVNDVLALAAG